MSVGSKALRGLGGPQLPSLGPGALQGSQWEDACRRSQTGAWRPPRTVAAGPASRRASPAQSGPNSAVTQASQASERLPESG